MPDLSVNVEGVDRTLTRIKRDIHRGMEKSAETLVSNAKDKARQVISEERAIFNAEVYEGFRDAETKNTPSNVRAKLYNDVEHAEVLEEGAQFLENGPPVEALLPWVARKMRVGSSFDPNTYGGFPDSFGGGDSDDGDDDDSGGNTSGVNDYTSNDTTDLAELGLIGKNNIDLNDVFGTDDIYLRDRKGLKQNYLAEFDNIAPYIYEGIEDWKSGGSKDLRETSYYSTLLQKSLNVDADVRGNSKQVRIRDFEKRMIKSLNDISKEFLDRHYDDDDDGRVQMYRTLRYESPKLSRKIWDNPSKDEWNIPTNVVNNYTTTRSNLQGFDRSLLHQPEVDIEDDVLIAIDALIHSDWDREGEVHLRGDYNDVFRADDLEFQSETYSDSVSFLTDQFFTRGNFNSFTDEQMVAIASTIREMGKNRVALSTEDGKDRVDNFIEGFLERGLESNTNYSADEWIEWRGRITGSGEVLEFDGRRRGYSTDWNTYNPLQVETVPLDETYDGQRVELLDLETEGIVSAEITSRNRAKNQYVLETDFGEEIEIFKPQSGGFDNYKIIAGIKWDTLSNDKKSRLIEDKVDDVEMDNFDSSFEDVIRRYHKSFTPDGFKDKKLYYDIMHGTKIEKFDPSSNISADHIQFSNGSHRMRYSDSSARSVVFHETMHGVHDEKGFSTDHYPDESLKQKLYKNLFDEDGNNITSETHTISDVLLQKDTEDPLGLPADGSIPEVIKKRVEDPAPYEYDEVGVDMQFLDPIDGNFQTGDRIIFNHPSGPDESVGQLTGIEKLDYDLEGIEYEGDAITSYEIEMLDEELSVDIWVDDNGEYVNMQGIQILKSASQPDEKIDKTIPDIELEEEGFDKLIEAVNLTFMEMSWIGSVMKTDGKSVREDSMKFVGQAYSVRAANETLTVVSEILRSKTPTNPEKSYIGEADVISIHENYPHLVEAWIENFNPSPEVAKILKELGYDL